MREEKLYIKEENTKEIVGRFTPLEKPWLWIDKECVQALEPWKSTLHLKHIHMNTTDKFNWFQKKMIKIFFGITIEDYKE